MATNTVGKKHGRFVTGLASVELVFAIGLATSAFMFSTKFDGVSHSPYWAGLVFVLPCILGILAGLKRNHTMMVMFLVFNICCLLVDLSACYTIFRLIDVWSPVVDVPRRNVPCMYFSRSRACICRGHVMRGISSCDIKAFVDLMYLMAVSATLLAFSAVAATVLGSMSMRSRANAGVVMQPANQQPMGYTNYQHDGNQGAVLQPANQQPIGYTNYQHDGNQGAVLQPANQQPMGYTNYQHDGNQGVVLQLANKQAMGHTNYQHHGDQGKINITNAAKKESAQM